MQGEVLTSDWSANSFKFSYNFLFKVRLEKFS